MTDALTTSLIPLGQDVAWSLLNLISPKLPPALLLTGPEGVGKRQSVRALFQSIVCTASSQKPCGICAPCRKVYSKSHSDFLEISTQSEQLTLDDFREMKSHLCFRPLEAPQRFILIDEAHRMNMASANSLLKTLEEPPHHTRFFLTTTQKSLLLPTIVSRCQTLSFKPLNDSLKSAILERAAALQDVALLDSLKPLILQLMGDGVAHLDEMISENSLQFLEKISLRFSKGTERWHDMVSLAEELASQEDGFLPRFLDLLVLWSHEKAKQALQSSDTRLVSLWSNRCLEVTQLRRRLSLYANRKLVALNAALEFSQWKEQNAL